MVRPMSERSIYLRDQATKCAAHAVLMTAPDTRAQLLALAAEYMLRAVKIENEERDRRTLHSPSVGDLF
jgi:hypothetical protein